MLDLIGYVLFFGIIGFGIYAINMWADGDRGRLRQVVGLICGAVALAMIFPFWAGS